MPATVRVTLHSDGIRDLLKSEGVRADLRTRGERVLAAARATAPVVTGGYRDSLTLVEDTTDRAVVRVESNLGYALIVEAATGTLSRALDAAAGPA